MQPGMEVVDRKSQALSYRCWVLGSLLWGLPTCWQPLSHLVGVASFLEAGASRDLFLESLTLACPTSLQDAPQTPAGSG